MIGEEQLLASFLAGFLSFFAPCVLPLFPAYFSVITGFTFSQLYGLEYSSIRRRVFLSTIFFALGFVAVFTLLGSTSSLVGKLIDRQLDRLLFLNGFFLIGLGIVQLGIIRVDFFKVDFAWRVQRRLAKLGYITAFVTGIASSLSWIPCVGPLLAPILFLAAKSSTLYAGTVLLFIYSLGLTLPFVLASLSFTKASGFIHSHRKALFRLSQLAGVVLILFGLVLLLGQYRILINKFYSLFY